MKEKKNENIIFLNLIREDAQMGLIGIDIVLPKIKNEKIAKIVNKQQKEYENIVKMAEDLLLKYGYNEKDISKVKELTSKVMGEVMSLKSDDKKIVELMINGNQKGVIEIKKSLNEYQGKDAEIIELAEKLLATEEHNREEFKNFL